VANDDVIVAGIGAMGSAAAYQLARRGQRVSSVISLFRLDRFAAGQGAPH
jgi:glycine/D-amino acid oxidase-like deaminating enzyme